MTLQWTADGTIAAPFTPSDLADIWEWWEPWREGLANNDPIATLTGQVAPGAGHDWGQTDANEKPTFKTNVINGLGAALFGPTDHMSDVNPSALTAAHWFLVIQNILPTSATCPWRFGTSASSDTYALSADNKIYCGVFSSTRRDCGDPAPPLTDWHCIEVVSTSSEWTCKLDGNQLFTTATNTVASPNPCTLAANTSTGSLVWNNGYMAGIYICSAKLDSTERGQMVNYLNSTFDLSII
jgi:hypothetical protein